MSLGRGDEKIDLCGGCDSCRELLPLSFRFISYCWTESYSRCVVPKPTPDVLPRELLPILFLPRATPGLSVFKFGLELEHSSLSPNLYF